MKKDIKITERPTGQEGCLVCMIHPMKLEVESMGALCSTEVFRINSRDAASGEFGEQHDEDQENAEPYACGDMQFKGHDQRNPKLMSKYGIDEHQYDIVVEALREELSFGSCGWCV